MSKAWPIGIAVGLGMVGVANAIMISIALTHPSTPASADHWAESLDWDRELAVREASAALGWSLVALEQRDDGTLELELRDADQHALLGLRGRVSLARADRADFDRTLELRELGAGRYVVVGELPLRGQYQVTVEVQRADSEMFVVHRVLELRDAEPQRGA